MFICGIKISLCETQPTQLLRQDRWFSKLSTLRIFACGFTFFSSSSHCYLVLVSRERLCRISCWVLRGKEGFGCTTFNKHVCEQTPGLTLVLLNEVHKDWVSSGRLDQFSFLPGDKGCWKERVSYMQVWKQDKDAGRWTMAFFKSSSYVVAGGVLSVDRIWCLWPWESQHLSQQRRSTIGPLLCPFDLWSRLTLLSQNDPIPGPWGAWLTCLA